MPTRTMRVSTTDWQCCYCYHCRCYRRFGLIGWLGSCLDSGIFLGAPPLAGGRAVAFEPIARVYILRQKKDGRCGRIGQDCK